MKPRIRRVKGNKIIRYLGGLKMVFLKDPVVLKNHGIFECVSVSQSRGLSNCRAVDGCHGGFESRAVQSSFDVSFSWGVYLGNGVIQSRGVYAGDAVVRSKGVFECYGVLDCIGISHSIFCISVSGSYLIFNKSVDEDIFWEVKEKITSFHWFPHFCNARDLLGCSSWDVMVDSTASKIAIVDNKTAWSSMPEEMKNYIKNLPEYDEEIFNKITGDLEELEEI